MSPAVRNIRSALYAAAVAVALGAGASAAFAGVPGTALAQCPGIGACTDTTNCRDQCEAIGYPRGGNVCYNGCCYCDAG